MLQEPSPTSSTPKAAETTVGQPTFAQSQAIGDELGSEIYQPETTNVQSQPSNKLDDTKGTQTQPEETEYELEGIKFKPSDLKKWKEAVEAASTPPKQAWEAALHARGMELNQREEQLKAKEKEVEDLKPIMEEYRAFRQIVDSDSGVREYFQKVVKSPQAQVAPVVQKIKEEYDEKFSELEEKEAFATLKSEFPDFDREACDTLLNKFATGKPYDTYKALYYVQKGLNLETEVQKRVAAELKREAGRPATPPVAGGQKLETPKVFKNPDEAVAAMIRDLGIS